MATNTHPPIANGRARGLPFQVAVVCWVDLLGYGGMIGAADFNPISPEAKSAITRLRAFHRIVAEHSSRNFRTLVLNDGAVAYRDLSLRSPGVTYDFLTRAFDLFTALEESERRNGWYGARMVLATGFRAKGSRRAIDTASGQLDSILRRMAAGHIAPAEAVREAASIERYFDVLPQLQANFAFTKAYLADAGGNRKGLGGPRFFVDTAIFQDGVPYWVRHDELVAFEDDRLGLRGEFAPVIELKAPGHTTPNVPGIRDGLQVADAIAPSRIVRDAIRACNDSVARSLSRALTSGLT